MANVSVCMQGLRCNIVAQSLHVGMHNPAPAPSPSHPSPPSLPPPPPSGKTEQMVTLISITYYRLVIASGGQVKVETEDCQILLTRIGKGVRQPLQHAGGSANS